MMATDRRKYVKKMDPDDVLSFVREHEDPGVTASEVASEFNATTRGARYRLEQLEDEGKIYGKKVGASGKIWFPIG